MATTAQIAQHTALINQLIADFEQALADRFDQLWIDIANLGTGATRLQIQGLFAAVNQWVEGQSAALDRLLANNVAINAAVVDIPVDAEATATAARLKQVVIGTAQAQVQQEQSTVIQTIVLGAIAGMTLAALLRQLKTWSTTAIKRVGVAWGDAAVSMDSAWLRWRSQKAGVDHFRYVGGIIATSRPFCRSHNNKVYTSKEIDAIWRQSWGGKAPGDPFVARGGYNCRHWWVAVESPTNTA